jgi:putative mRNA 3-end processing factor
MIIKCLGGCREVGRNGFLIETKGKVNENILLDYGMKVDTGETPMPAENVNTVLLSHQHLDHSGSVPVLYKDSIKKKPLLYATAEVFDHIAMLHKDSMKIARIKGRPAMFSNNELIEMKKKQVRVTYGQKFSSLNSTIEVLDAGHVPGAAMFLITTEGKKILFTGDYNLQDTRMLKGANIDGIKDVDLLIMESTYSAREHTPRKEVEERLLEIVKETVENGGIAVIPSFAVGRAAEIIMILDKLAKKIPIFLDGMARQATRTTLKYPELLRDPKALAKAAKDITFVKSPADRKRALEQPCAIVTTGGCIDGGPAVHYIKHLYTRTDCSLTFTGFMIPRTAGRYLQDTGRFVNEDMDLKIKMQMNYLDFSGHSGRTDLFKTVQMIRPKKVMCIHGDHCERFATELKGRFGIEAIAPFPGSVVKV